MSIRSTKTPFRYMSKFKAFAGDYEYLLTLSDEGRLYCLSEQQVYAIEVQLDYIGWLTRWYNTDDITQTTVDRLKADIAEALMSCVDVSILVDQANENLITTVTNRAIQSQTLRDAYEAEYIPDDPTSINPDAPTTTWSYSDTPQGDEALCAALMAFVYQFARFQADSVRAGQIGGLAAISLIAVLLIPGLNIFFVVGAAIAVLAGLGVVGVTTETAITALTDTTALDEVVCCMKENLKDASVSEATWAAALGGCGFTGGSNAQIVADFLSATLASNYLTFLDFMGTAYVGAGNAEEMPTCPCADPPPDPNCADLTEDPEDWQVSLGRSEWIDGTGWTTKTTVDGTFFRVTRPSETVSRSIAEVRLSFNIAVTNMRVSIAGVNCDFAGPTVELVMNETNFPSLFPFTSGAPNSITVMKNVSLNFSDQPSMAMIESCLVAV